MWNLFFYVTTSYSLAEMQERFLIEFLSDTENGRNALRLKFDGLLSNPTALKQIRTLNTKFLSRIFFGVSV
jgi:hypothetical protein